jgi:hypothetical protein
LSDNYWKAECDINILNANPYGYGTGEVVMALTAGTLDFMSYGVDSNYTETSQDGIAVILVSSSSSDENMNDWFFCIEGKKDNNRTYDLSSLIYANSSISHYYIRLERSSKLFATLSVFSDSTFTNHLPGSPIIFKINSAITNLNTLQHGTITPGFYPRFINATIDNDLICDDLAVSDTVIPELPVNRRTICSENQIGNKILLYPNPSSTFIIINNQDSALINENDYYRIYNLLGNLMTSNKLISNKLIDISTLPEGVFLFIVSDSKKTCWAKFKKHY